MPVVLANCILHTSKALSTLTARLTLAQAIHATTMPSEITKKDAQAQQVAHQSSSQGVRDVETQEHHARASASGGLNLNIFGALSGALSSASKKTTHKSADGAETSVEERRDQGKF